MAPDSKHTKWQQTAKDHDLFSPVVLWHPFESHCPIITASQLDPSYSRKEEDLLTIFFLVKILLVKLTFGEARSLIRKLITLENQCKSLGSDKQHEWIVAMAPSERTSRYWERGSDSFDYSTRARDPWAQVPAPEGGAFEAPRRRRRIRTRTNAGDGAAPGCIRRCVSISDAREARSSIQTARSRLLLSYSHRSPSFWCCWFQSNS